MAVLEQGIWYPNKEVGELSHEDCFELSLVAGQGRYHLYMSLACLLPTGLIWSLITLGWMMPSQSLRLQPSGMPMGGYLMTLIQILFTALVIWLSFISVLTKLHRESDGSGTMGQTNAYHRREWLIGNSHRTCYQLATSG